jgi:hypothetical protein
MTTLNINGRNMSVDAVSDTPLLWAIREQLQMTGTTAVVLVCAAPAPCTSTARLFVHARPWSAMSPARRSPPSRASAPRAISAEGLDRRAGAAMRLLPVRANHAGRGAVVEEPEPDQGRGRGAYGRESLPLHDLFADPEGDHAGSSRNAHRFRGRQ